MDEQAGVEVQFDAAWQDISFILLGSPCMLGMVAERKDAASWRSFDGPPAEEIPPLGPGARSRKHC